MEQFTLGDRPLVGMVLSSYFGTTLVSKEQLLLELQDATRDIPLDSDEYQKHFTRVSEMIYRRIGEDNNVRMALGSEKDDLIETLGSSACFIYTPLQEDEDTPMYLYNCSDNTEEVLSPILTATFKDAFGVSLDLFKEEKATNLQKYQTAVQFIKYSTIHRSDPEMFRELGGFADLQELSRYATSVLFLGQLD